MADSLLARVKLEASRFRHGPNEQLRLFVEIIAALEKADAKNAVAEKMAGALGDARGGLLYVREHYGDLYGVGFDRSETASCLALAEWKGLTDGD